MPDSMIRKFLLVALAAIALTVGACREDARQVSPQARAEREAAYRQACVSRSLAARAEEDLETLEMAATSYDPADPFGQIRLQASLAALGFNRAYQAHADLRVLAYASLDSAVNHATTPADSLRHLQRALAISTRPPTAGTLEANVLSAYLDNFTAMLEDEDHPCNWDLPF